MVVSYSRDDSSDWKPFSGFVVVNSFMSLRFPHISDGTNTTFHFAHLFNALYRRQLEM